MMGSPSMNGGVEKPFVAVTKMEPLDSTGQNLPPGRGPQRISISASFSSNLTARMVGVNNQAQQVAGQAQQVVGQTQQPTGAPLPSFLGSIPQMPPPPMMPIPQTSPDPLTIY